MGRPKGSKNKPKEEPVVAEPVYTPAPDMGTIQPDKSTCECGHKKAVHYGPTREWCNTAGCECQDFISK